jgi:uncharacterized protein YdhG (YjbR/CyaY superfamily)
MSTKKETPKSAKNTTVTGKKSEGLTAEEKAAMKETLKERKAFKNKEEAEKAVLEKIGEMTEPDRSMATRIHAIIKDSAPALSAKTWYGMPAYANQDGKVVCFFQTGQKFGSRYATFGFQDSANLDDGVMWPTSFALKGLTAKEEKRIEALVKKAVS